LPAAPLVQPAEQREIDRLDLPGQRFLLRRIEPLPEGQEVFLAVWAEDFEKVFSDHLTAGRVCFIDAELPAILGRHDWGRQAAPPCRLVVRSLA
jgi:hypothetical protein